MAIDFIVGIQKVVEVKGRFIDEEMNVSMNEMKDEWLNSSN